ncbi:restriction endonuclease [Candidatus Thiodubiliella endoseptemdiera]|uniref:restriction endonuclease n=1 Tax=Candidatus Thiodubiliella endoseptemdiera TaxID=2738886 RepID=UPI0034DDFCE1
MNHWTKLSIEFANQRNYLDELFRVYPTIPEGIRDIDENLWQQVEQSFQAKNNVELLNVLLKMDLFPIKDSYTAYLKRDSSSISRNPNTVDRLCGRLYEMGLDKIFERCSEPKETNRQIGPLFKCWLDTKALGIMPVKLEEFISSTDDAILDASDAKMMEFARKNLEYKHNKGLDFVARFNGKYVIGEAKFLTDFGGHQNAQFNDAMTTVKSKVDAVTVAILDGVPYIESSNKMCKSIRGQNKHNIMSALVLREFLYSL